MEAYKKESMTLKELMKSKKYKDYNLIRLLITDDWSNKKHMDNDFFKFLIDWKNKEYIGDENGSAIFDDDYYINEYNNYLVYDVEDFDGTGVCLNMMLTPNKNVSLNQKNDELIKKPELNFKLPLINKKTNIIFGNGITLEILKNTKYSSDYLGKTIVDRSLDLNNIKNFFSNNINKKFELHVECSKVNMNLPLFNALNKNNNNSLNLWIDTFFAYKYEYIDELNNNEYVRFITNDIDTSVIDSNCYNLIKSIQVENFKYNFDYIDNFIYWTKTQFRKKIHEILKVFSHITSPNFVHSHYTK